MADFVCKCRANDKPEYRDSDRFRLANAGSPRLCLRKPMSSPEPIVCKPTPWFLFRAAVMLLMFLIFSVLFYLDGSTGYRKKNESYYLNKTFQEANKKFSEMNSGNSLTAEAWKDFAAKQTVAFPSDASVLPAGTQVPMAWPPILHDFEKMKPLQWNLLWREYSKERGLDASPGEHPFDAGKIREQWIVFWICIALSGVAGFFLLRTVRRSISVDGSSVTDQKGRRVAFSDLKSLDLRKWDTKGLAFIGYDGAAGKGTLRIDGLTYGGFKKEHDEPAERLMRRIRENFSGEIIEYEKVAREEAAGDVSKPV